jgi:hypothetical protein
MKHEAETFPSRLCGLRQPLLQVFGIHHLNAVRTPWSGQK